MNNKQVSTVENTSSDFTLAPKLRFPEFRDKGEWGCALGNAVFDQVSNKDHNSDLPILAVTQEHGAIPRDMIDYNVSVTDKSIESYKVVEIGDFIISLRSFQGGIEFSQFHGICSPAYVILRLKPAYSKEYFKNYLKTERFIVKMTKNLEGLRDGKMISYKQFSELKLPIPEPEEQQKIADCLSSLDVLIGLEAQKIDALKRHKKGLIQQLFPSEGETHPRLRFPEFDAPREWEEKPFSTIVNLISGMHLSPDAYSEKGEVPYFSGPSDFTDKSSDARKWTASTVSVARGGDTLITVKGSGVGEVWFSSLPAVALGRQLMAVRAKEGQIRRFVFQFLLTKKKRFEVLGSGNLIPGISRPDILDLLVSFPEPPEQQRIADCLTFLDDLIAAETRKLDTLKTHKKGLMQQLFPQIGEADA